MTDRESDDPRRREVGDSLRHEPGCVTVRIAQPEDRLAVSRVLDGAMLAVEGLPDRIAAGDVLVAVDDGTACGALVLSPEGPPASEGDQPLDAQDCPDRWRSYPHLLAIAVRRRRRDQGVGTALVRTATDRLGTLVADFEDGLQPFYESLGAELVPGTEHRWWALIPAER